MRINEYVKLISVSFAFTLSVILICCSFFNDFFSIDDTLNDLLGFYKQFGKIWLSGHIPFITSDLMVGGNAMIELERGIFLPTTIITSIIAYKTESIKLTGIVLAFINLNTIFISSYFIAKKFKIRVNYAYAFAAFVAINPMFLYQYSAAWWNAAIGQAWGMAAIASFFCLREKISIQSVLVNFLCVVFMLNSGWPHSIIAYAALVFLTLCFDFYHNKDIRFIIYLALPSILALFFSIPVYSEYIYSSELINRPSGFHNFGNFLSPSLDSILFGFSPTYYSYMNYFIGYKIILIPIGFSTLIFPFVLFYKNIIDLFRKDHSFKLIVCFSILFLILSQLPTQFGPLRWSFRFVPFLSFSICLITFYALDKAIDAKASKHLNIYYGTFLIINFVFSFFMSMGEDIKYIILQLFVLVILFIIPKLGRLNLFHKVGFSLMALVSLIIMLVGLNSLGNTNKNYLPFPKLPEKIEIPSGINLDGYILSLTGGNDNRKYLHDLNSAQFGVYHLKSINGYAPVGNKNFGFLLPHNSGHAMFYPKESLYRILQGSSPYNCIVNDMKVSVVILRMQDYMPFQQQFMMCGYVDVKLFGLDTIYLSLPKDKTNGWNMLPPTVYPITAQIKMLEHSNNFDKIEIFPHQEELELIFPRVYWKGYTAKIGDTDLAVLPDYTQAFVKVIVPRNLSGTLLLSYFPYTWRYVWWLPLLSVIGLLILFIQVKKKNV
ncbi:hypothetical protein [Lonepinella sp. MS14436]|uniref:hypothetical protein n=1 Tax=Lonepinella sp. MS14436 TaxID=3003619 RepID=UPI0036D81588